MAQALVPGSCCRTVTCIITHLPVTLAAVFGSVGRALLKPSGLLSLHPEHGAPPPGARQPPPTVRAGHPFPSGSSAQLWGTAGAVVGNVPICREKCHYGVIVTIAYYVGGTCCVRVTSWGSSRHSHCPAVPDLQGGESWTHRAVLRLRCATQMLRQHPALRGSTVTVRHRPCYSGFHSWKYRSLLTWWSETACPAGLGRISPAAGIPQTGLVRGELGNEWHCRFSA